MLQKLIILFAKKISEILEVKNFELIMADGTGFGFEDSIFLSFKRGKELRKVKSHVMTEVLVTHTKGISFFVGVNTDKAYTEEGKLLLELLKEVEREGLLKGEFFVADSLYGNRIKVLEKFKLLGFKLVVNTKESLRRRIRHPLRKEAKEMYETNRDIYWKRYRIEQAIGIVKECFGDRDYTKKFYLAQIKTLIRFLAYNVGLFILLQFPFYSFFQTPSVFI
ncbi:MAG: hypothetical protein DSZ31_03695 [Gammaproteobacteria bacterium]|nr:MAG: hypothetical protein DSZ31_03695 [Gammaproteobacteria bacterium]